MSNKRPLHLALDARFSTAVSSFYESGYQDGYNHGRTHGLIEGRALGREKGYEMWEELGFYEGFASTWRSFLQQHGSADDEYDFSSYRSKTCPKFNIFSCSLTDVSLTMQTGY
jgi:hypothetical protein